MKLYWLDLETTGLDHKTCEILEIALIEAELLAPFEPLRTYHAIVGWEGNQSSLHSKVIEMHTKNGLFEECARSTRTIVAIEHELLTLVPEVEDPREKPVLAGSSIHFDHDFIREHLPILNRRLSHRHYDVSAVKLFARSLGMAKPPVAEAHRALDDIRESIEHAKTCRDWLLKNQL